MGNRSKTPKRPKKNIILFLVEGKSDREALQIAISEFYDLIDSSTEVFFPIIREEKAESGGDITSKIDVHPRNIEDNIYEYFLKDFFDEEKIFPKDITEIVQIVDLDGAYIPDEAICKGVNPTGAQKVYYDDEVIVCDDIRKIIKRNECKRENLDYLSSLTKIKVRQRSAIYSVYYFSCNLDHFLHNSANLDRRDKCNLADIFASNHIGNPMGFAKEFLDDPDAVIGCSYSDSWDYIKEGTNSLKRHTNINLLFDKLISRIE